MRLPIGLKHRSCILAMETTVKRGRGRPRKNLQTPVKLKSSPKTGESHSARKSGRSKKVVIKAVVKQHRCKECKSTFATKSSLKLHMHSHNGLKPISCKFCSRVFLKETNLRTHMRCHTDGTNGPAVFTCTVCSKTFAHLTNLKIHTNRHTGSRPYKCKAAKCDAAFADAGTLRRHRITVHSDNAPYQCQQCDAKFKRKDYLETHLRRIDHTDQPHKSRSAAKRKRPKASIIYNCEECDEQFTQRSAFMKHAKRMHRSPNNAKVEILEPAEINEGSEEEDFGSSDSGTRKGPYVCEQCNGEFDHRRDLRKHIKVIHGSEWLYICEICEIAFKHKCHLEKHNAIHSS